MSMTPGHTFKLLFRNLCLRFLYLISRNHKARSFRNLHHSIHIFCCLQLLLKTCISLDGFQESLELLF